MASLACCVGSSYHHSPGIYVKRLWGFKDSWRTNRKTQFVRIHGDKLEELNSVDKNNGQHNTVYVLQESKMLDYNDPIPRNLSIFGIGWQRSSTAAVSEQLVGFQVFPTASWNPQTHIFTANRHSRGFGDSGALGAILTQHKSTSTLTVFGVSPSNKPWVSTLLQPPFEIHEWVIFKPSGTETATSQAIISDTASSQIICEATIWADGTESKHERKTFVVLISVKIISGKSIVKVPDRDKRRLQYIDCDSQPRCAG